MFFQAKTEQDLSRAWHQHLICSWNTYFSPFFFFPHRFVREQSNCTEHGHRIPALNRQQSGCGLAFSSIFASVCSASSAHTDCRHPQHYGDIIIPKPGLLMALFVPWCFNATTKCQAMPQSNVINERCLVSWVAARWAKGLSQPLQLAGSPVHNMHARRGFVPTETIGCPRREMC